MTSKDISVVLDRSFSEKFAGSLFPAVSKLRKNYDVSVTTNNQLVVTIAENMTELSSLKSDLDAKVLEVDELRKSFSQLKSKAVSLKDITQAQQAMISKYKSTLFTAEASLDDLQSRYQLICSAVSPKVISSDRYRNFTDIIENKLLPFMNRVGVVENEAEQVTKIKAIDDQFRLLESLRVFAERTVVAVAGGFSSGKSSFISSLFATNELALPIGIEPVTAIPTYVFHSDNLRVTGYTPAGGQFDIAPEMYKRLSHKYLEEFGFNLKNLLPFVALETPLRSYEHLSFIDLPGYNPGNRDGATSGDSFTSSEFLTQAQKIVWVIGFDANGTISSEDIEILTELTENEVPLYVVLNKADLRPFSTLQDVIDEIEDELSIACIPYEGICAYSSENGGELLYGQRSLDEVLSVWNTPQDSSAALLEKLNSVLDTYEKALHKDTSNRESKVVVIKALELNLLELGAFDTEIRSDFNLESYFEPGVEDNASDDEVDENESVNSYSNLMAAIMGVTSSKRTNSKEKAHAKSKDEVFEKVDDKNTKKNKLVEPEFTRSDLINTIRDQIQGLKNDYQTESNRKLIKELKGIRAQVESLF